MPAARGFHGGFRVIIPVSRDDSRSWSDLMWIEFLARDWLSYASSIQKGANHCGETRSGLGLTAIGSAQYDTSVAPSNYMMN